MLRTKISKMELKTFKSNSIFLIFFFQIFWQWYFEIMKILRSIFYKKTKFLYVYFRVNTNRSEIRARASSLISRRRDDVITITLLQWRHRLRFRIKMIISQFQLFQLFFLSEINYFLSWFDHFDSISVQSLRDIGIT